MQPKWRMVAATSLALLVVAVPARAFIIPDPVQVGLLTQIIAYLGQAELVIKNINGVMGDIHDKWEKVYPWAALRKIQRVFSQTRSVEDELHAMSCNWGFHVRTQRVWDGVFKGLHLCKPELQSLVGEPVGPDADLQELADANAVIALNTISTHLQKEKEQSEYLSWLAHEAVQGGDGFDQYSVGYYERLTAQATAALGSLAVQGGDIRALDLKLRNQAWMDETHEERMQSLAAHAMLSLGAGEVPGDDGAPAAGSVPGIPGEPPPATVPTPGAEQ